MVSADESGEKDRASPIIVGILPVPLQESQMLESLLRTLIMHICCYSKNTLFQYGAVEIVTFLSARFVFKIWRICSKLLWYRYETFNYK